jgi:3-deoxy-D-manno-octulosonic-acid transferase
MKLPFFLRLYRLGTRAFSPMARVFLARRRARGKEDAARIDERRGMPSVVRPAGVLVWMHGASVGETVSLLPLVERFIARGFSVLLTSGTVTSSRVMGQRLPEGAIHQFVPLDTPAFVARFLDHWAPDLALVTESEIWPNMVLAAHARDIPLVLVNARLSERSFRRWQYLPGFISALLERFDICLAQSDLDAERLRALGAPRVVVTGNMKFDVAPPPADRARMGLLRRAIGQRPVWIAASTHDGEELAALAAHAALAETLPDLLTIIAPRHPERGEAVAAAATRQNLAVVRRSEVDAAGAHALPAPDTAVYVADTIGELGLFYRLCPAAFLGGSLVRHGGQNPIEPAKLDTALLHGPYVRNFADIYAAFDGEGGAREVRNADELAGALAGLLSDGEGQRRIAEAAARVTADLAGAVERTMQTLEPYLMHILLARNGLANRKRLRGRARGARR